RERDLLARHGREWLAELPEIQGVRWDGFRRGFVAAATFANFPALRAGAAACWAAAPVEAVSIRWPRQGEGADALAPIPALRELSLTGQLLDHADASRLAALPLLSTLRALNVRNC